MAQVVEPLGQNTAINSQSFQVFNTGKIYPKPTSKNFFSFYLKKNWGAEKKGKNAKKFF